MLIKRLGKQINSMLLFAYPLLMGFLCLTAWAVARWVPFYRRALAAPLHRYATLDGLRGLLATGVFFHHAFIGYAETHFGEASLEYRFYLMLGQVCVSLFFCITGFLFWDKALQRSGRIPPVAHYLSRLRRLLPAYLFSVLMVAVVAHFTPGFVPDKDPRWTTQFFHILSFQGIKGMSEINGVYWTLVFEWQFYLLLPLVAAVALRGWRFGILSAALIGYAYMIGGTHMVLLNFITGAACAHYLPRFHARKFLLSHQAAILLAPLLIAIFTCFDTAYNIAVIALLAPVFMIILYGNDLFGLLSGAPLRVLGMMSYSLYLLHAVVLFAQRRTFGNALEFSAMDILPYGLHVAAACVIIVAASAASFRFIEYPFMRSGNHG